ncbi:kinase-like domain-containing protein [Halenospora varia]|nr:kinase-like domain-containing protein [Halenospora varia]
MATQENKPHGGPLGSDKTAIPSLEPQKAVEGSPTVRFASNNEEIEPATIDCLDQVPSPQNIPPEEQAQLKELSKTLHGAHLQERRMSHFAFEPVSLPASRVPSNESSREPSRHNTRNSSLIPSPHQSPRPSTSMHSPPITPAATRSRDAVEASAKGAPLQKVKTDEDPAAVTPQISPPGTSGTSPSTTNVDDSRPTSSGAVTRPTTGSTDSPIGVQTKHHGAFSIGPSTRETIPSSSVPGSRDQSPSRATHTTYSRPFTPAGDVNDPYAAHKRPPQSRNLDAIDQRFKFTALNSKHRISPSSSTTSLPRSSRSTADVKNDGESKRHSNIFGGHKDHLSHLHDESSSTIHQKHGGSMSELKRFLKIGGHHKAKRAASPAPSSKSGTKTPPHHKTPQQLPFDDNHGLTSKYGKFGKVLGAGAGGSVRLMKRSSDGTTFAVKQFRDRHSYESEKEYAKKVTAEFCVGSTLHHGNIIETLDIIHEKGKWYEVMEYAPFDLFAIVMTGKMSREEISCSFLQILSGVTYLHSMGLAHRDMKLDNVVVNEFGIMKIIDFGSASVFKYPFEGGITLASGIVGSDPYLAPEVYDERKYDPQPTDIWSLAIIFCCMSLRRFPWKMPRMTDNSYKLFASPPTPGTDMKRLSEIPAPSKSTNDLNTPARDAEPTSPPVSKPPTPKSETATDGNGSLAPDEQPKKPEVIKGPWRLLRLLPRESRHIMSRMLEIDPKKRAKLEEILNDDWVANTNICRQEPGGKVIAAEGHTHTLEPPAPPAPSK